MSEMVERVARALCIKDCCDPNEPEYGFLGGSITGYAWQGYVPQARAAIAAMMEPTLQMIEAGWPHTADPCWESDVADAWRAMINAALQEPTP